MTRASISVTKEVLACVREIERELTEAGLRSIPESIRGTDRLRMNLSTIVLLGVRTLHAVATGKMVLLSSDIYPQPKKKV